MSEENLDLSRRELLRNIGISVTLSTAGANVVTAQDAGHVHHAVSEEKARGPYKPKCFNAHEYATLTRLSDLIMPADEHSKSAVEAGAPEFIDVLASNNEELANIYTGGISWLDQEMTRRHQSTFMEAKPEQQTALLDLIAYRKNESPELGPGIRFFAWVRNMVVDAYFTSKIGMDYLGFQGNGAMSHFSVPAEAVEYALKRSPVR
ncbi:MAG TPA: gluconate 2-dehydrogenase subunit 3 family protein [Bryobacteraceae bacterium]|nr:gluconate 2-dehydrogenase subunit 3 family protein [Bryobacteraceae bacterium]